MCVEYASVAEWCHRAVNIPQTTASSIWRMPFISLRMHQIITTITSHYKRHMVTWCRPSYDNSTHLRLFPIFLSRNQTRSLLSLSHAPFRKFLRINNNDNYNNNKRALVVRQYTEMFSSAVQRIKHAIKQWNLKRNEWVLAVLKCKSKIVGTGMSGLSLETCLPYLEFVALGISVTLLIDRPAAHWHRDRHTLNENIISAIHSVHLAKR